MPDLTCIFCGGRAKLHGRGANANVICMSCGMETGLDAYRDQINVWMETICEKTFDDPGSRVYPESKKSSID